MIAGKQITIRQLELGDEEYLHKWWNDGSMMAHAGFAFGVMQSKESIRKSIQVEIESNTTFPTNKLFIICKNQTMEPIGEMSYGGWSSRDQKCEFGIKICEASEQGKGYGIDALYHFIDYLFRTLNLNKIELTSMIDNKRAHSLYKKLGFKEIGVIRQSSFDSRIGAFRDIIYMDLLKSEWIEIKSKIKL